MLVGFSRTTATFATASGVTHPVSHSAATSAFCAISHGLETMRQAADAAVAVVLRLSRENPLRALDTEDTARRNRSRSAIRRSWWRGSLNSLDPGRKVVDKGNCNGRNREAEELLQIEVPPLEATV